MADTEFSGGVMGHVMITHVQFNSKEALKDSKVQGEGCNVVSNLKCIKVEQRTNVG